ncbi:LAT2 domain-containing protein isoform X2 [Hoplias malabaricus]|uniref:LAT2 domain-containing protein isoform X2 n=1 Tax=Hoplias malabaricus TaxID=27720 RepID=UPI0034631C3F
MVEITSQQGAVLALVSVVTLGIVSAVCLGCRRKSMTRPNQIISDQSQSLGNLVQTTLIQSQAVQDIQGSYQNLPKSVCGSLEPTYVHPIPTPPYSNLADELMDNDADAGSYENVFPTKEIDHDSDSDEYVNTLDCLQKSDEDEPDYVNTGSN